MNGFTNFDCQQQVDAGAGLKTITRAFAKKIIVNSRFEKIVIILILLNILCIAITTVDSLHPQLQSIIDNVQLLIIGAFTIEYFLRIFAIKRVKEFFNFFLIVDFFAITLFYITLLPINFIDFSFLRTLRLFKIFQVLKIGRHSRALRALVLAVTSKKDELVLTLSFFIIALIVTAFLMHGIEGKLQQNFSSIPKSLIWVAVTFANIGTAVGYGDFHPITSIGKIIAFIFGLLGVCLNTMLVSILAAGFIEQLSQISKGKKKQLTVTPDALDKPI
jgi:voltage-gated potassium channel